MYTKAVVCLLQFKHVVCALTMSFAEHKELDRGGRQQRPPVSATSSVMDLQLLCNWMLPWFVLFEFVSVDLFELVSVRFLSIVMWPVSRTM